MTELYALHIRAPIRREIWADFFSETPEERRERALRFRFPQDKKRCICAYALFRYVYTRRTGRSTAASLCTNSWGKPYLAGEPGRFNLSHAGDWVVCAWSGGEVGADVERVSETDPAIARYALHPAEYRHVEAVADVRLRWEMFCDYWTLKESYVKYLGTGLSLPSNSFRILLEEAGGRLVSDGGSPAFYRYKLDEEHRAAVCAENREGRPPLYRLTPEEIHSWLQNNKQEECCAYGCKTGNPRLDQSV